MQLWVRVTLLSAGLALVLGCDSDIPEDLGVDPPRDALAVHDLSHWIEAHKPEHLPAVGMAIIAGDRLVAAGAFGQRALGVLAPVTVHDRWHLGSITKSMTATLVAMAVARDELSFDTTVAEIFADIEMADGWDAVSVHHLLHHRSGAPALGTTELVRLMAVSGLPDREVRRAWLARWLAQKPTPDAGYAYSNAGYMILGTVLEEVTYTPWRDLIRTQIYTPLGMTRSGFGPPIPPFAAIGHRAGILDGKPKPVGVGPDADNPPALGPAARAHAPLADWAKFVSAHLAISRGALVPALMESGKEDAFRSAFAELHGPVGNYACGWVVSDPLEWAKGRTIWHNGSNARWYALQVMAPKRNVAILAATNTFTKTNGEGEMEQLVQALVDDPDMARFLDAGSAD